MGLLIAAVLVIAFVANVVVGSISGDPFIGNVGEMILLLAASVAFVFAILKREADDRKAKSGD